VFIGLNGSGKTAILDAIALLVNETQRKKNSKYSYDDIRTGASYFDNKISLDGVSWNIICNNKNEEQNFQKNRPTVFLKNFIYYKTNRKDIFSIFNQQVKNTNFDEFIEWFIEEENFENSMKIEKRDFNFINQKLDIIRMAINKFFNCIYGENFLQLSVKRERVTASKKELQSYLAIQYDNNLLKLEQLSSGQKALIYLVSDIAYRLIDRDDCYYDCLNNFGIVLIDEIELHLHPQWQREVLPALQKTFPNIQFIVTTHSPQVISNIKREEVFILEDNKLVEHTPYTQGRDSNAILYELFGVEKRPLYFKNKLSDFYTALEDDNIDLAKIILNELTQFFGEQDTEIVTANLHLNFALK
jgi:predicted ATP-binding protein involved in virulence